MSTAGKVAALSGLIGIVPFTMPTYTNNEMLTIIAVISALTMFVGNITAIKQTNIKRMLAYSSVGHAGYMLMGIVSNNIDGTNAILYYSLAYILTQIGAFAVIGIIETKEETQLTLSEYAGLSNKYPFLSATLTIFLFSLAGIPPFAGFFGKYFLFKAAITAGFTWLTIIAVITSIIACYFYLSVIVAMYFKPSEYEIITNKDRLSKLVILLSAIGIIAISFIPFLDII
jgi:NADH-quinone oxidoreductase subunit N